MDSSAYVVSVEREIPASAQRIFDVLANPRRHRDVDGSGTLIQVRPDAPVRLFAGARFTVNMHRILPYAMTNTVTQFEDGKLIAWSPKPASGHGARFFGRIWRYEFESVDGGTLVRETWDITHETFRFLLRYSSTSHFRRDMAKSLERLEGLLKDESSVDGPDSSPRTPDAD